jgi:hypothetical protein
MKVVDVAVYDADQRTADVGEENSRLAFASDALST